MQLQPDNADAWLLRGITLMDLRSHEDALASLDTALRLRPDHAETWSQRGLALTELRRNAEALQSFQRVLQLRTGVPGDWLNQGVALNDLARPDEAIACFRQALQLDPAYADAWSNQGMSYTRLQRLDEAIRCFDRALALQPGLAQATWNKSLAELQQGDWAPGWRHFEARWQSVLKAAQRHGEIPRLESTAQARGRRVLVWCEQGLGDTLQFFRYVPLLEALCGPVTLETDAALLPLLSRHLQGRACAQFEGGADFQIPLMSLPGLFATRTETVPARLPYLQARPDAVAAWGERLVAPARGTPGEAAPDLPRMALACSGNPGHGNDLRRSCALREFAPLLGLAQVHLVQKRLAPDDAVFLQQHPEIRYWGDQISDFDDTAAILAHMDLVVSVDTSLVHLAGAMNRPVWVVLPHAADWRWLSGRTDSPWYPGARLFRQFAPGDWTRPINAIARRLQALRPG